MNPVFIEPLLSHSFRRVDAENSQSSRIYLVRSSTSTNFLKPFYVGLLKIIPTLAVNLRPAPSFHSSAATRLNKRVIKRSIKAVYSQFVVSGSSPEQQQVIIGGQKQFLEPTAVRLRACEGARVRAKSVCVCVCVRERESERERE